jgi:broad specificity phosphatase PhoE
MNQPVKLYLVRHGQTELNRDRRFRGLTRAPLNDRGRLEARGAAAILKGSGVDVVRSSPVPRALETAAIIAESLGAHVETDEGFTDVDYGQWQGLTVEEVGERFGPEMLESWKKDPGSFVFPDGDSMRSVRDRLRPAIEGLAGGADDRVVVVSHLAVLKVCFVLTLELPFEYFWRIGLDNGSVSHFTYTPERGFVLEWWNRAPEIRPV